MMDRWSLRLRLVAAWQRHNPQTVDPAYNPVLLSDRGEWEQADTEAYAE